MSNRFIRNVDGAKSTATRRVTFVVDADEYELIRAAAGRDGVGISAWGRTAIRRRLNIDRIPHI